MHIQDSVSIQVTRGAESWQFFAFIFAAVFALAVELLQDSPLPKVWWQRILAKALLFAGCFYLFMLNHWMRNLLADILGWLKVERY